MGLSEGASALEDLGGWTGALARVMAGSDLSAEAARAVMGEILSGQVGPAEMAGMLVALRMKGETVEEITGLVAAMYQAAQPLVVDGDLLDVVGTGGDRLGSINVSTLAALIAAGAGAPVCKHGNRAASSSVGTADVLEALGVVVDLGPAGVAACLEQAGMGFCFAPRFHPAMRHAGPVRRALGVPTIFNFLGPLANPARATFRLVGVSDPAMAEKMAGVLGSSGCRRAMVVYGDDGLDELTVTTTSRIIEVVGGGDGAFELAHSVLRPEEVGLGRSSMTDLRGGDASWNAAVIRGVLEGSEEGGARDIGLLNAAAALVVAGTAGSLGDGLALAASSVDAGRAAGVLERLVATSKAHAEAADG